MFLGSEEVAERLAAKRADRDSAQHALDQELAALWKERPAGWGMTQICELAGVGRAEILASIARVDARKSVTAGR